MPDGSPSESGDAAGGSISPASALDPLFHEPARLAVLSALSPAEYVDVSTLLRLTGVSKSALSKHLSMLAGAGVVSVSQSASDKRGRRVALTPLGRASFTAYLAALTALVRDAQRPGAGASSLS